MHCVNSEEVTRSRGLNHRDKSMECSEAGKEFQICGLAAVCDPSLRLHHLFLSTRDIQQ